MIRVTSDGTHVFVSVYGAKPEHFESQQPMEEVPKAGAQPKVKNTETFGSHFAAEDFAKRGDLKAMLPPAQMEALKKMLNEGHVAIVQEVDNLFPPAPAERGKGQRVKR